MTKISYKISVPVILAGFFAVVAFLALDYKNINFSFYILLLFIAIYVFFFGFATGQRFASPVKKLLDRATEMSKGNLSTRVYLETKDEIAELAKVFNKLAGDLEESRNKEESTEKSVDIKVKAKTQGLEETINALEQKVQNRTIELQRVIGDLNKFKEEAITKDSEVVRLKEDVQKLEKRVKNRAPQKPVKNKQIKPKNPKKTNVAELKKIAEDLEALQKQTKEREEKTEELISEIRKIKEPG
ncbi:MAG: hypothetical protein A2402_03255 [Candidatus Staskawiczbacteria bacterium RIFOXYC1_FULL_37_43]|nr:MAG: hypothetical protein A2343_02620 [Candidatus Moranbacteria bacterium RIFOXYB12_FULL_35_8]OGZ64287.1 MAG: hypothetical protein A2813_02970 [Candidatus Staskawiczbacteria bacterium RIFCSPHIGHO2_01_FULL_37_17]OGZ71607.1 MAG: hypothetical protein A2891_02845 [Candidatus Staskawiczbacteria bacterium RIFCSPLOWO2_01_FULL_37_19]OGZ76361.1 MAG: hypothetical protein A2205_01205 [Candidatus Staskawiczbacteria bacterium RIFOXYA1_FULL_37_15]OGZ77366.1 MAG: hypothetical protein A2280_00630 [Candidatu